MGLRPKYTKLTLFYALVKNINKSKLKNIRMGVGNKNKIENGPKYFFTIELYSC